MKHIKYLFNFKLLIIFFLSIVFIACKKEIASTSSPAINKLPIANAGVDQTIILPTDSVELSGSSTGNIISYKWSQISGPNQSAILDSTLVNTTVKYLVKGVYQFQLKVTNASGDTAVDNVVINVVINVVHPEVLALVGKLSIKRANVAVVAAGNKIFFAGGNLETLSNIIPLVSRVDIYDIITKTWSTAELSEARCDIGAVVVGNKILFASGGNYWDGGYWGAIALSTRVDIYDLSTNNWSTTEMPGEVSFRNGWDGTTAAAGNKAIFCDAYTQKAYIYDVANNTWTTNTLSISRRNLASASLGNKIFIAGSGTSNVDVYDVFTNLWTIESLSESRGGIRASTLNNKAFFAGGGFHPNYTDKVDIYDIATQTWSIERLSRATVLAGAAPLGNKMLFFGDKIVDIYDTSTKTWSISELSEFFSVDGSIIISAGGNVYATKGNQVWRVQL